ncbi:hypothetical protein [Nocardia shimofusensis]|uniref:hypothetical protein n=1 Tax=Nocardia shimofusensis TaxID=228596 RepID=UPI0012ED1EC1|nr:hypothetical protein [Nocardia shimofusensis]
MSTAEVRADPAAVEETAYLLGTPANARRLERSLAEHRGGEAVARELISVEDE